MAESENPTLLADVAAVKAGLGARDPKVASAAEVEAALLRHYGLGELSDRLWLDGVAVSAAARKSVRHHMKARFGARAPRTGALTIAVFLLVLCTTAPLALLNSLRLGSSGTELPAAVTAVLIGVALLGVVALAGGKPFGRATLLQSGVLVIALAVAGAVGATLTEGVTRLLFIAGPVAAIVAVILMLVFRARDRAATEQIDNALEVAHLDVAPEAQRERTRMLADLASELRGRGDLATMCQVRTRVIEELREKGNPLTDLDPAALPGAYIIELQTNSWIPAPIAHARPEALGG